MKRVCLTIATILSFVAIPITHGPVFAESDFDDGPHRSEDDIWLVSSRHLSGSIGCTVGLDQLRSSMLDRCGRRQSIDSGALVSGGPEIVCIFVHGNRIEVDEVAARGLSVYRALKRASGCALPVRFVIWSWPSQQMQGMVRDGRAKYARSNAEAFYLASFLSSLPQDQQVSLLGFSLGSRIITGAMHLSAGGTLYGRSLTGGTPSIPPARVALMAAAVENDWLLPGRPHGRAMQQVDSLLLLNNSRDRALRVFHVASSAKGRPRALGHTGLPCLHQLGHDRFRVQQCDYARMLGRDHSLAGYTDSRTIAARMARHLLP